MPCSISHVIAVNGVCLGDQIVIDTIGRGPSRLFIILFFFDKNSKLHSIRGCGEINIQIVYQLRWFIYPEIYYLRQDSHGADKSYYVIDRRFLKIKPS